MDNSLWFQRLLLGVVAIGLVMMVGGGVWLNQALSFEDRATPLQGVVVDPDDPADVRIKGGFVLWGGPLILAGLGLLMIVPSLVVLLVLRASVRRRAAGG